MTRALMNACIPANQRASDLFNDFLVVLSSADSEDKELLSTEDFLFRIQETNTDMREGKIDQNNLVMGSLDIENL